MSETIAKVKCVGCGETRDIKPYEIPDDEVPMCKVCFMPMLIESVKIKDTTK